MTPTLFYGHGLDSVWPWRKDDLSMARKTIAHGHSHDIGAGNALWAKKPCQEAKETFNARLSWGLSPPDRFLGVPCPIATMMQHQVPSSIWNSANIDNCEKWFLAIIAIIKDHLPCSAAKSQRSTKSILTSVSASAMPPSRLNAAF